MYNYYSRVKASILTRLTQLPVTVDTLYTVQGTVHCTLHKDIQYLQLQKRSAFHQLSWGLQVVPISQSERAITRGAV